MNPKRHHYVPQFYLRYFSLSPPDSPRGFWVYEKAGGPPRQQTPVNTAVETHFYSVDASGVGRDDRAERAFAMLESAAKPILDRWQIPGVRPTGLEIQEIAGFLAFMHTRVPRAHQVAKEMEEALTTEWLKDLSKDPDRVRGMLSRYEAENGPPSITPEELTESLSKVGEDFAVEDVSKYPMALSLMTTETIVRELVAMTWCVCDAPTGSFFVTSDTPLNVFARKGDKAIFGAGFALPNVEIAFPVSPAACLFLSRTSQPHRRRCAASFVTEINRRTICMAERFVVAPYKTRRISSIVDEFKVTRTYPKIDGERVAKLYRDRYRESRRRP